MLFEGEQSKGSQILLYWGACVRAVHTILVSHDIMSVFEDQWWHWHLDNGYVCQLLIYHIPENPVWDFCVKKCPDIYWNILLQFCPTFCECHLVIWTLKNVIQNHWVVFAPVCCFLVHLVHYAHLLFWTSFNIDYNKKLFVGTCK